MCVTGRCGRPEQPSASRVIGFRDAATALQQRWYVGAPSYAPEGKNLCEVQCATMTIRAHF